jgi:hypothetical protein
MDQLLSAISKNKSVVILAAGLMLLVVIGILTS